MSCIKILLIVNCVLGGALSARILGVFPFPSISHQIVFRAVTKELVERGHEVTVLTPDPAYPKGEGPKNLIEIDVHDLSYDLWREKVMSKINGGNALKIMELAMIVTTDILEKQINSKQYREVLKNNTGFDLIIAEAVIRPAHVFSHVYKAPIVLISSTGAMPYNDESFGIPTHPLIYPMVLAQKLYNMTVWEKIRELYIQFFARCLLPGESHANEMLRRNFGEDVPSISELLSNVDLLILNLNRMWDNNRPQPPGVIQLSGLHMKPRKDLPEDLKSFLDASKNGIIYMSFGTNFDLSSTRPDLISKFNNVFARLPYDVIWKTNTEVMPGKAQNVRLMKWLPQADLLHHPNIKAFITQAGLQSSDEAIDAGVPLIAFPTAADQWYNAELYTHHKIGIQLDLLKFSEEELYNAIKTVIEDKSYRQNIKKMSNIIKDTPDTAINTAAWWIEHVIRHGGGKHLRARAAGVSWSEYLMLDVIFTLLSILVVSLVVLIYGVRFVLRQTKTTKQKSL